MASFNVIFSDTGFIITLDTLGLNLYLKKKNYLKVYA